MPFEIDLIQNLHGMSNDIMDIVGKALSFFGGEMFFMIVAVFIYWCIDKKFAYRLFNSYILGVAVNNGLKSAFKRPRPFDAYAEELEWVEDGIKEKSYSFPSGHTNSIASISTLLTIRYGKKHKSIPVIFTLLIIAVMFSRMYLGQHYLSDVIGGLTSGIFFAILFNFLLSLLKDKEELFVIAAIVVTAVLMGVLAGLHLLDSNEDLVKGVAAFMAFDVGYFIEKRFVKYDIKEHASGGAYFSRIIIGGSVLVGIYMLKFIFPQSNIMINGFLRYVLLGLWASLLAPCLFKLAKL